MKYDLNFCNFSVEGCQSQHILHFQKLGMKLKFQNLLNPLGIIIQEHFVSFRAINFRSFHYETPCTCICKLHFSFITHVLLQHLIIF